MGLGFKVIAMAGAIAAMGGTAGAATLLVAPDSGCGKATCFSEAGVFTRTWSAKDFTGPVSISRMVLDRAVLGALDGETFRLSFSLGGQELGTWGHFNMGAIGGDSLSFSGEDLVWNPEDGDLVLTLALDLAPKFGGAFGGSAPSPSFSRTVAPGDEPPPQSDAPAPDPELPGPDLPDLDLRAAAAVTAAVPEPSTWAMMILGFGLTGAAIRARPRSPAPAR